MRLFGKHGAGLSRYARGIDDSPIVTEHEAKSLSQETTFARDVQRPGGCCARRCGSFPSRWGARCARRV